MLNNRFGEMVMNDPVHIFKNLIRPLAKLVVFS